MPRAGSPSQTPHPSTSSPHPQGTLRPAGTDPAARRPPLEPRGSSTLTPIPMGTGTLCWTPHPTAKPISAQHLLPGRAAPGASRCRSGRAAASRWGRAGCLVAPLPASALFTPQPRLPNRSVRSGLLLLVNSFLHATGRLLPGHGSGSPGPGREDPAVAGLRSPSPSPAAPHFLRAGLRFRPRHLLELGVGPAPALAGLGKASEPGSSPG